MRWRLAGALAFIPHLVAVIFATSMRPGFSHRKQYLSELGERGSDTEVVMNFLGIFPTGLLIAVFGLGLLRAFRGERLATTTSWLVILHAACRMIAAVFPCDVGCRPAFPSLSQSIHDTSATLGYVSLTAAVFFAGAWLVAQRQSLVAIAVTYALGIAASVALLLLLTSPGGNAGLYQRLGLFALQLWLTLFAVHLINRTHGQSDA